MRTKLYLAVVLVLTSAIAYIVVRDPDYDCAAKFNVEGQDIVREEGSSPDGWTSKKRISTFITGALVSTSVAISHVKFFTNLRGDGKYRFEYSPNMTSIRVEVNQQLLYEGVPIPSLVATAGEIAVEPRWTGDEMGIKISDQCSVGSFLESFFR